MITWSQLSFQDALSPTISQLIFFHDHAITLLSLIITLVFYAFIALFFNKLSSRNIVEAQEIETVWTVVPALSLLFLALPSLRILYLIDETNEPAITLKIIGHQWYWSYEYSDFNNLEFDSYIIPTDDLSSGDYRLLEVDNRVVLPYNSTVRAIISAADVIHSWAIPALGVKVDAIPGRLNQVSFSAIKPSVLFGQCSEICGANHSFIPICVEFVDMESFSKWIKRNTWESS